MRTWTYSLFHYDGRGPASEYAVATGQNEWAGGEKITPLTFEEAEKWGEKNLDADECDKIFGEVDESGEKQTVAIRLSQGMLAKLKILQRRNNSGSPKLSRNSSKKRK